MMEIVPTSPSTNPNTFMSSPGAVYYNELTWVKNYGGGYGDNGFYELANIDANQSSSVEWTKWAFPPSLPPPLPLPGWKALPYGLEQFWMSAFMWLFTEFYNWGQLWCLKPVSKPPKMLETRGKPSWITLIHSAKVRFNCQKAGHGWTSVLGRVAFWHRQKTHPLDDTISPAASGQVLFKLYGQKCQRCGSNEFETALWYPEEISNAVWHLYAEVAEQYYGKRVKGVVERSRQGKPVRPHKPQLCQACADGICRNIKRTH